MGLWDNIRNLLVWGDLEVKGLARIKRAIIDILHIHTAQIDDLTVNNLTITGDAQQIDVTHVNDFVIGDDPSDTLEINSSVTTSIVPKDSCQKNLGSPSKMWKNGYFNGIVEGDVALQTGTANALPAPGAAYVGQYRTVLGGAGVEDKIYCCRKSEAGVYYWDEVGNGGIIVDYGTALPAASEVYEGKLGTIRGDATHRSRSYICERSDAQVFNWVEFVNGGA